MSQLSPWYWRSLPLAGRTGSVVFTTLFAPEHAREPTPVIATLLESPYPQPGNPAHSRYSICAGPPRVLGRQPQIWTPKVGTILPCLRQRLGSAPPAAGNTVPPEHLPFMGGWLGWLGYDLAWEIEALPPRSPDPLPFPVAYWYEPETFAVLDHEQQSLWLATSTPQHLDTLAARLQHEPQSLAVSGTPVAAIAATAPNPRLLTSQAEYEAMVRLAQQHIQVGDIFQANLSLRFQADCQLHPWTLYRHLQQINPSPFASYWQTPWGAVVSCSPERLVQLQGQQAQTRPIAGTRARGSTATEDRALATTLKAHPKELAEHIMLVDLERNDLGRICNWGTVEVNEFLALEYYSHVMHLVSNVRGNLDPQYNAIDLIRAVFPGGTITGCPKVRCLEIIDALEPVRRNLFYGSCGYLDYRGHLDLNILIRTLLVTPPPPKARWPAQDNFSVQVWGQVGAGIVADSQPEQEWQESWQKAQAQLAALQQIAASFRT